MPLSFLLELETRPVVKVCTSRVPVAFVGKGRVALLVQL